MDIQIARNLSIKQIRAFVCVANSNSFSKAARELAISQPALTLTIQQFEEIVGVALLERTTRSVSLTELGREFLPKAEKILADIDTAILSTRASNLKHQNQIKIAALTSVAIRILPFAKRSYGEVSPETIIHIQDDNGRGVHERVLSGEVDFGVSNIWNNDSKLEFTPFIQDKVGLICHHNHPLARVKKPLVWQHLNDFPFVGMAPDTGVNRLTFGIDGLPAAVMNPTTTVLTIAALVGLLGDGKTITALPALATPDYLNSSLVYRELSVPNLYRGLCIIAPKNRRLTTAAQGFVDFLQNKKVDICAAFPSGPVKPS